MRDDADYNSNGAKCMTKKKERIKNLAKILIRKLLLYIAHIIWEKIGSAAEINWQSIQR